MIFFLSVHYKLTSVMVSDSSSLYVPRRWVRLLFGREFTFQDLIVLWDAIFADSAMLDLVDYIFVAMLIKIRELCKYPFCFVTLNSCISCSVGFHNWLADKSPFGKYL